MLPKVVITGRPNVGKSTLFNRLSGRRLALVADTPGVTRDRKEAEAVLAGAKILLVDTAGLEEAAPQTLPARMRAATGAAVADAALVLFCFDARTGLLPEDRFFANWLRRSKKPVLVVANKAEGRLAESAVAEAYQLGLGDPIAVSAEHNEGIYSLMVEIAAHLPAPGDEAEAAQNLPLHFAIVGRPNAGKSTLANALLGNERLITGPEPGITRDAIAVDFTGPDGKPYRLVDTAGLRKRAKVDAGIERMSTASAIEALKKSELAVLAVDALRGLDEQDLHIGRLIEREGRACIIALTKWDAVEDRAAARKRVTDRVSISLSQLKGISVVPISAETGEGMGKFFPALRTAYEIWNKRIPTSALNRWFDSVLEHFPPPLVDGHRPKLRYITQVKARPPTFAIFGTRSDRLPDAYHRYLVNNLREAFDMPGVPIRLLLRGGKNPYAENS